MAWLREWLTSHLGGDLIFLAVLTANAGVVGIVLVAFAWVCLVEPALPDTRERDPYADVVANPESPEPLEGASRAQEPDYH